MHPQFYNFLMKLESVAKIQNAFVKVMSCNSWDEAQEKYPLFTTAEKLEPFKTLDFSKKIPEQFMRFCHDIIKRDKDLSDNNQQGEQDNIFWLSGIGSVGIIWKEDLAKVSPDSIGAALKIAQIDNFRGFQLSIIDLTPSKANSSKVHNYS